MRSFPSRSRTSASGESVPALAEWTVDTIEAAWREEQSSDAHDAQANLPAENPRADVPAASVQNRPTLRSYRGGDRRPPSPAPINPGAHPREKPPSPKSTPPANANSAHGTHALRRRVSRKPARMADVKSLSRWHRPTCRCARFARRTSSCASHRPRQRRPRSRRTR